VRDIGGRGRGVARVGHESGQRHEGLRDAQEEVGALAAPRVEDAGEGVGGGGQEVADVARVGGVSFRLVFRGGPRGGHSLSFR